jgi:hypothetical protein
MNSPTEKLEDEREDIVLTVDEWIAVEKIISVLPKIPGICQRGGKLLVEDDSGSIHPISHGKLRHYLGTICRFFDTTGRRVHPTGRLVSSIRDHKIYPGVRIVN